MRAGPPSLEKIGIFVEEYDRSVEFYARTLELESVWKSPTAGNAGFRTGSSLLVVQESPDHVEPGGARIYLTVADVAAERDRLVAADVAPGVVEDLGEFRIVEFEDPDGNRLGLMDLADDYVQTLEGYLGREVPSHLKNS